MCASKAIVLSLMSSAVTSGKNLDSFKSNITKRNISMRIPYADGLIWQNNAGFCATRAIRDSYHR